MKKFWIAVVGAVLAIGPAMLTQDVVTGVKDVGKDIDKGAKKPAKGTEEAADKTADATKDAAKEFAPSSEYRAGARLKSSDLLHYRRLCSQ
jgi:hypothetical protein